MELELGQQLIPGICREKKSKKDIRLHSFSHRIVGTWNDLPPNAKAITALQTSKESFKNSKTRNGGRETKIKKCERHRCKFRNFEQEEVRILHLLVRNGRIARLTR